eukprot:229494_1
MAINFLLIFISTILCGIGVESQQTQKWQQFYQQQILLPWHLKHARDVTWMDENGELQYYDMSAIKVALVEKKIKLDLHGEVVDCVKIKFKYKQKYEITTYIKQPIISTIWKSEPEIHLYIMSLSKQDHDIRPGRPILKLDITPAANNGKVYIAWVGTSFKCDESADFDLDIKNIRTGKHIEKVNQDGIGATWLVHFSLTLAKYFQINHVTLIDMGEYPTEHKYPRKCPNEEGHIYVATCQVRAFQNKKPFYIANGGFIYSNDQVNKIYPPSTEPFYMDVVHHIAALKTVEIINDITNGEQEDEKHLTNIITALQK